MELKHLVSMELSYFMLVTLVIVESTGITKTVPYMKPMLIGRTFDLSKSTVGYNIFDSDTVKLKTKNNYLTTSNFRIAKTKKEVRDVLDVSGQLSLQILGGAVNVKGEGKYLKESAESSNIVEVIVKITFETITESIINVPTLKAAWNLVSPIGQHYVRGITYGGYLIASLKFEAKDAQHKDEVDVKLSASVGNGFAGAGIEGQFKKLSDSVNDISTLRISYFATAPLKIIPTDIDSLLKAIHDFPDMVTSSSVGGRGVPIQAHLAPLSQIDVKNDKLKFLINSATQASLNELNLVYFDLISTINSIKSFTSNDPILSDEAEFNLGKFYDRIFDVIVEFNQVIADLDLRKTESQFDKAYNAYKEGKYGLPGKFKREYYIRSQNEDFMILPVPPIAYMKNGVLRLRSNNSYTAVAQLLEVETELHQAKMELEHIKTQLKAPTEGRRQIFLTVYIESQACNPKVFGTLFTICGDDESTSIQVNGKEYAMKQRGHNIVVVNANTGEVTQRRVFGTHVQNSPSVAMKDFLKSLPKRRLVLVGIQYSGEKLTNEAIESLKSIGGHGLLNEARASYALIGWTGPGVLDATAQVQTRKLYGSSIISKVISLPI